MARWLTAAVLLVSLGPVDPVAQRGHRGLIVAADAQETPLAGARAMAYAERNPGASGPCPQHTTLLDPRTADGIGAFTFQIGGGHARYYAVYCQNGYQYQEQWNTNDADESALPEPVRLWKDTANAAEAASAAQGALESVLDYAANTLRRLRGWDDTAVPDAMRTSKDDGPVIQFLLDRKPTTQSKIEIPRRTGGRAALQALDNAGAHYRYFWRVAPGPFTAAAQRVPPAERQMILRLRDRGTVGVAH